ncbi:MAG TPA: alpha/beta family hydrolase [Dehalococcoidia bacterium]|nr:alpha/beta family hydrolase [Dehalococcoidia bacterium]
MNRSTYAAQSVEVSAGDARLDGDLALPDGACGVVAFAHGSGSSRRSPRNRQVAAALNAAGFGTLLFDLLTPQEALIDERTAELRFDIALLGRRMTGAVDWLRAEPETHALPLGLFGASTGAAAALLAAADRPEAVAAVVSRGGRPDLAGAAIDRVRAPVLLIVGGNDPVVIELNRQAQAALPAGADLRIVPGATHLFEEPGALAEVVRLAADWFDRHLAAPRPGREERER